MRSKISVVLLTMVSTSLIAQLSLSAAPQLADPTYHAGIFEYLKELNYLNIALLAFSIFAGSIWIQGRNKLKQIGELFIKAYEFTDDKCLSAVEREELLQRFLAILGKAPVPTTTSSTTTDTATTVTQIEEAPVKKKRFLGIFKRK